MPVGAATVAIGAFSAISGRSDAKKARELQAQQIKLGRDQLDFAKKRYDETQTLYGETRQKLVDQANVGVNADLEGVTNQAVADVAQSFEKSQQEADRNLARYGINPNSGRAIAAKQGQGIAKAAAEVGLINLNRKEEKRYADETTWDRRALVGQMGSNELANSQASIDRAGQSLSTALGNAASNLSQSASAAYQTAGQFAGMGLTAYLNKPAATKTAGTNPVTPTFMYPAGSANGPVAQTAQPINVQPNSPFLSGLTAANTTTYPNLVARH